jgi:hypothetical protein
VAPVVAEAAVEEPVAVAPVTVAPVDADVTIGPPREY